jgi:hypothetical protein
MKKIIKHDIPRSIIVKLIMNKVILEIAILVPIINPKDNNKKIIR